MNIGDKVRVCDEYWDWAQGREGVVARIGRSGDVVVRFEGATEGHDDAGPEGNTEHWWIDPEYLARVAPEDDADVVFPDSELTDLATIWELLAPYNHAARTRILDYLSHRNHTGA